MWAMMQKLRISAGSVAAAAPAGALGVPGHAGHAGSKLAGTTGNADHPPTATGRGPRASTCRPPAEAHSACLAEADAARDAEPPRRTASDGAAASAATYCGVGLAGCTLIRPIVLSSFALLLSVHAVRLRRVARAERDSNDRGPRRRAPAAGCRPGRRPAWSTARCRRWAAPSRRRRHGRTGSLPRDLDARVPALGVGELATAGCDAEAGAVLVAPVLARHLGQALLERVGRRRPNAAFAGLRPRRHVLQRRRVLVAPPRRCAAAGRSASRRGAGRPCSRCWAGRTSSPATGLCRRTSCPGTRRACRGRCT